MQVIECDVCGETLGAADRAELTQIVGDHLRKEHGKELSEEELTELVESEAYEAMDS